MALVLLDRAKETTIVLGTTASAILLGAATGYQSFAGVGNTNTTYYCIAEQAGTNWEVGLGTYTLVGTILTRAVTPLSSSNAGASVSFPAGTKDVFIVYPSSKGVWLDGSGNAIGLGTPAAFVGTNITGTATAFTASNVTTNANLTGAVTSLGNATSLGSFTSAQLATALTDETGTGANVFATSPTLVTPALGTPSALVGTNITGTASGLSIGGNAATSSDSIGNGQTWQNVTASRVLGTTYTNSTGRSIAIQVSANSGTSGVVTLTMVIAGVTFPTNQNQTASGGTQSSYRDAIIPSGATYIITTTGTSTATLALWVELR